jgi:antitoxin ParD1/3/4
VSGAGLRRATGCWFSRALRLIGFFLCTSPSPPEQEQWLNLQIDRGVFTSVEDAVRKLIAERMAFEADDLAWGKLYVDGARAAVARGEVLTLEEAVADMRVRLGSLTR